MGNDEMNGSFFGNKVTSPLIHKCEFPINAVSRYELSGWVWSNYVAAVWGVGHLKTTNSNKTAMAPSMFI